MPDLSPLIQQASQALLQILIPAVVSLVGWGVKLGIDKLKSEASKKEARALVRFANQRLVDNQERLEFVIEQLMGKLKISNEEAHLLAEEAVVDLKNQLGSVGSKESVAKNDTGAVNP